LKQFRKSIVQPLVVGFLFLVPVYLAILLLLKAMKSLGKPVQPVVRLLPAEWRIRSFKKSRDTKLFAV